MSKQITIEYFGMTGTGETVTKAKQDAGRKIEAAMKGSYYPTIIGTLGQDAYCALLVRHPMHGWGYSLLQQGKGNEHLYPSVYEPDFETAERMVRRHLADLNQDIAFIPEDDHEGLRQWESKQEFNRKYQEARDKGYSDNDAHLIAGGMQHLIEARV